MLLEHIPDLSQEKALAFEHTVPDSMMYVSRCGQYKAGPEYCVTRGGLNNFLLIHTQKGQGHLTINNKRHILSQDTCIIIDCRTLHNYRTLNDEWQFEWVHFHGPLAQYFFDHIGPLPVSGVSPFVFRDIKQFEHKSHRDIHIQKAVCNILYMVLCAKFSQSSPIDNVPSIMEVAIARPISLDEIAERVNMSKYYFIRLFKKQYGDTPANYYMKIRINHAIKLLKDPVHTQKSISEACGFSDTSSFIRAFKRTTGTTPAKYKDPQI